VREGDPQRLRKRLQGDLDCFLLTALRKGHLAATGPWSLSVTICAAIWRTAP
jgi:hypothetical protein